MPRAQPGIESQRELWPISFVARPGGFDPFCRRKQATDDDTVVRLFLTNENEFFGNKFLRFNWNFSINTGYYVNVFRDNLEMLEILI